MDEKYFTYEVKDGSRNAINEHSYSVNSFEEVWERHKPAVAVLMATVADAPSDSGKNYASATIPDVGSIMNFTLVGPLIYLAKW
jgi:hypothetical protein